MSASIPASLLEKFTTFGDLLRFLRRRAGITQLELSIAVGYSDAQISRLEQNLRLPDIPTIEARFLPALGLEEEPKAVARLLDLAANVRREDAPGLGLCPYKGLNYFDETDADLFAGREDLTANLADRVLSLASGREPGKRCFLAVVGASGSGKSSLVRAGLVPALRWNKMSANWPIILFTPTAHPLESLAAGLTQDSGSVTVTAALMDDLQRDARSLNLFVKRTQKNSGASHLLLVVDQFEELFSLCRSEEERTAFIDNLLLASSYVDGPVITVITLRADFYASCAGYPQLRDALARQQVYIGAMSPEELRRAIEEPARRGRWELEPGLVDLLLREVGREPGALPLLSHALFETWLRRRGRTLTLSGYASSGGVRGAIAETAEAVFADQFNREQQAIARRIFLRLTELGDEMTTGDTRRRAFFDELIMKPEEEATTKAVLKALADARLVITSQDSAEVAHEALIREWPTLRGWLEENREGLRLHRRLTEAAQEWLKSNREPDGLYRGARLAQAHEWAAAHAEEMNALECEFLEVSQALSEYEAAERESQRQRELEAAKRLAEAEGQRAEVQRQRAEEQARAAGQLRKRALYLAGAFVIAVSMAFVALFFGAQARQAAIAAQDQQRVAFSRELAAAAISNLDVDPERSILLALQAVTETYSIDQTWTAEAEDALRQALQASRLQLTLHTDEGRNWGVAFSPDGRRLANTGSDGTARVWDAATGELLLRLPTGDTRRQTGIAFSPDGRRLATAGEAGTAGVWDSVSGQQLFTLRGHSDWVTGIAFSPDGKRLATASEDRTLKIWDAATGQEQRTLVGHTAEVWGVTFSPDGVQIASASGDGSAKVWDAFTGEELNTFSNQASPVTSVAFSPDGRRLATGSVDGTAKVWDAASGEILLTIRGHTSGIAGVAFSPDGARLATAGFDGKVKVWDTGTGQELFTLSGHTDQVVGVTFSPDGRQLATTSFDGTVKVWNAALSQELFTLESPGSSANAISPDGTRLATGFMDGGVKIWDIGPVFVGSDPASAEIREILSLSGHTGPVWGLAFSPDGAQLATTSEDQTVKVWDLATGKEGQTLRGHTAGVHAVAFSPDGERLVTSGQDGMVRLWDLETGLTLLSLNIRLPTPTLAFSPDGTRLVGGLTDGTAKLWDAATGEERLVLRGHTQGIYSIAFSPDGKRLATASDDGTVKVWDANSGQVLLTLTGNNGWINGIAFSPDGERVVTAGQDGSVRLWDGTDGQPTLTLPSQGEPAGNVAFSPDGKRLLVANDGIFRFYLLNIEELVALAQTRLTRTFTVQECQQYLHRQQCPDGYRPPAQVTSPPATPTLAVAESPAAIRGRVCQLTDQAGVNDQFYNQKTYQGLQEAADMFAWETAVFEPQQLADIPKKLTQVLNSSCNLIVAPTSFFFSDLLIGAAEGNPDQKFLTMEWGLDHPLDNVWAQAFAVDQAGFLAGYVAASVTRTGKVGTFGGINIPGVTDFMDGFGLGVHYYNEKNSTQVEMIGWDIENREGLFTGDFEDINAGRQMGEKLMEVGADILLPVAGNVGLGTAAAVKKHGDAYLIGVDSDWALTFPEYGDIILTSIEKRMDVSVVSAVQSIVDGTFTGGAHDGTLANGGVSLAPFHELDSLVSEKVKADLEQIKQDIVAGKINTKPR